MSVYIMGDTHYGNGDEIKLLQLKKTHGATDNDVAIICGDVGFVWDGHDRYIPGIMPPPRDYLALNKVSGLGFITIFCPGNHENYDALGTYPIVEVFGGKARQLRENIFMMVYGEIYTIEGKKYWNCGGASSIDRYRRVPHISWWPQEIPNNRIVDDAVEKFENNIPDYAITHAPPYEVCRYLVGFLYRQDNDTYMMNRFQYLADKFPQVEWHCGHLHVDDRIKNCFVHYDEVYKVG